MKAHQNRDMTYDEMNDYVMSMELRNLREVAYCHYFNHKIYCSCAHMSVMFRASTMLCIILAMHRLFPLLEESQLAQHASPDEAHRAVDSSSCGLGHHGAGVLAQLRRKRWILTMDEPQRCRTHWG